MKLVKNLCFWCIAVGLCLLATLAQAKIRHEVYVDAGSSGSRLHEYQLSEASSHCTVNIQGRCLTDISETEAYKITPGVSSLAPNQNHIDAYLDTLFASVLSSTQPIDVYFMATAGMRQLPTSEQQLRLTMIQSWFDRHPQLLLRRLAVISGEEEGLYGWLSVNYALGRLAQGSTVPVMDFGGVSVEVSYQVETVRSWQQPYVTTLTINGHQTQIYLRSYLGIGLNTALLDSNQQSTCRLENDSPGTPQPRESDFSTCQSSFAQFITTTAPVQPLDAEHRSTSWYTLGALPYYLQALMSEQDNSSSYLTLSSLKRAVENQACNPQYPQDHSDDANLCARGAYFIALLQDSYDLSSRAQLHWPSQQAQGDWTLGAALMAGSS